jgi:hypothetical protein
MFNFNEHDRDLLHVFARLYFGMQLHIRIFQSWNISCLQSLRFIQAQLKLI